MVRAKHPGDLPYCFDRRAVKPSKTCQRRSVPSATTQPVVAAILLSGFSFSLITGTQPQGLVFPDQLAETGVKWEVSASNGKNA